MIFARDGKKWTPFSEQTEVLGVVIDLSCFNDGVVYCKHTYSRKAELDETIAKHLNNNHMTHMEAEPLR